MADPVKSPYGSSPGSPGLSGALKDAIGAIANVIAPRSVVQIKQREDQRERAALGEDEEDDTGRMKAAQSTDKDNGYQY
jgi:hypothetical protein